MSSDESRQNLERFREMVVADGQLFTQLRGTANLESFVALAVQLGGGTRLAIHAGDGARGYPRSTPGMAGAVVVAAAFTVWRSDHSPVLSFAIRSWHTHHPPPVITRPRHSRAPLPILATTT